jgi:hypothetical protein
MAARDYSREPYRKLLRNPSPSFRMLDALSQGIGYVLIREADDDGWLPFAIDFEEGLKRLWKLITVPPRQRSIVARCIKDLLDDGMVQHLSDRLMVKNLYEVNRRRDEGPKGPGKGPQKAAGATPSQRSADAEPTLSEPPATPERTVSERSATLERTIGDTPAALERTNETDPSARNDSSEPASRARLQVGRKVGRKVGREEATPDAPWFDLLGELERGRDLFGLDADLEATSERLAETIAGDPDPRVHRIPLRQVGVELVARARSRKAKFKHMTPDQVHAEADTILIWILQDVRAGKWTKPPQSARDSRPGEYDADELNAETAAGRHA